MAGKKLLRDRVEHPAVTTIVDRWTQVKQDLSAFAQGVWEQEHADEGMHFADRARKRIVARIERELRAFRDEAVGTLNTAKRQAYETQFYLTHWILDQATPPNVRVRPKRNPESTYRPAGLPPRRWGPGARATESHVHGPDCHHEPLLETWFDEPPKGTENVTGTGETEPSHEHRVDAWLKTWGAAAASALMLGSIQGDSSTDVGERVEDATANGYTIENILSRMVRTEVQVAIADADDDFRDDQKDLVTRRVWTTMNDERVCPRCAANEDLTDEEVQDDIPLHPVCRCWWRIEPVAYQDLAGDGAVPGAGSTSMTFKDPATGEVAGQVVVEFDVWRQQILD